MNETYRAIRLSRLSQAVTLALATLGAAGGALAQQTNAAQEAPASATQGNNQVDPGIQTVVISTRKSQQSSIQRKKAAATAMDSIVAEDVGALPDRNIGEAISRMAGIALDRGDFGEGVTVSVRGNGPDLTRVEVDGQGVQSAGGTDANGGGNGRGVEFRQLSADLIKSVDVIKGATADQVEGSLGGEIVIKTRTGLDFKEPFASVRLSGTQNSLNKKWEPDLNVILSRKFMDNRLGVILNASKSQQNNEKHEIQPATSAAQGYARLVDFDNSPDKTFTYNPSTLNMADPASTLPTATYPYTTGTGSYATATPLDILNKSAAAKTKADCYTAFPQLTTTAPSLANLASGDRTKAVDTRTSELVTCLNQWNDYTPSLVRNFVRREIDKRQDLDLRADFKVNNELTVYAKGSYQKRQLDNNQLTYGLGGVNVNTANYFTDANGVRGLSAAGTAAGYSVYPGTVSAVSGQPAVTGAVVNVNPASVVVDSSHHVTQFTISDGSANPDQVHTTSETVSKYFQLGGTWKHGPWSAEFFVGDAKSDFLQEAKRVSYTYVYGPATLSVTPNGLWNYDIKSNIDEGNAANYAFLTQPVASKAVAASATNFNSIPAYTQAQQPLLTQTPQLSYTPKLVNTDEKTAKLDLTYAMSDAVPFMQRLKAGFNLRDTSYQTWGGGGYTAQAAIGTFGQPGYVAPVVVPAALIRSNFVGCQDTPGSAGVGGNKCTYGIVPSNTMATPNYTQVVLTPAQYQDVVAQSLSSGNATATSFFNGAKGAPSGLVNNWVQIDVDKVFALTKVPYANTDCLIRCKATDGKVYDQPVSRIKERTKAAYFMADFNIDRIPFTDKSLPFGWELEGNAGWRYVRTTENGMGSMTFVSITKTGQFDPANPNAAGGTNTVQVQQNTPVNAAVHDFLPAYNLAMWVVPDQVVLRYNRAKSLARPPVANLLPSGTCTYDERLGTSDANAVDQKCSGTVGNPLLQSQKNLNQNWSAEWYPSKDTMVSLAYFKQMGIVGPALTQGVIAGSLLGGSNVVDPASGKSLSDLKFDYSTYGNGVPTTRKGYEFAMKTAFTFLPWNLRFLGVDANYTKLASVSSKQMVVDMLTGAPLPPLNESKQSYNWALWYDDGKFQARVAVQGVGAKFLCIAACANNTVNNYPNAYGNQRALPWNPGSPNFRDAVRWVDAKMSYNVTPNFQIFVEGRNLGKATYTDSQGSFVPFSNGTPSILDYSYTGRKLMAGINFRYGG